MVGQPLWKNLKILVDIDKKILDLTNKIKNIKQILVKDQEQIPKLTKEVETLAENLKKRKVDIKLIELKAQELKERELIDNKKLDKITNPKEYKALEKEIKSVSQQLIEHDNLLEESWLKFELDKNKYEEFQKEVEDKQNQITEGIVAQEKALVDEVKEKEELVKKRLEAVNNIPKEWLDKYERMRHKVPDPIVPVIGSACSACYYSTLRQDMTKLKKDGVLLCRNCYRFLYYDKEEENTNQESF